MFDWTSIDVQQFAEAERALAEAETMFGISTQQQLSNLERRAQLAARTGDNAHAVRLNERLHEAHMALGNTIGDHATVVNLTANEFARGGAVACDRVACADIARRAVRRR